MQVTIISDAKTRYEKDIVIIIAEKFFREHKTRTTIIWSEIQSIENNPNELNYKEECPGVESISLTEKIATAEATTLKMEL